MLEKHDEELNKLLDTYKVDDVNSDFLDRIVHLAENSNQIESGVPWVKYNLLLAAIALISFAIGFFGAPTNKTTMITEPTQTKSSVTESSLSNTINSKSISLDTFLLGPNSFEEVML